MTIDYRALCDELKDAYAWCLEECMRVPAEEDTLIQRARAALAQPEPEVPTDEEVDVWADKNGFVQGHGDHPCGFWVKDDDLGKIVRAALAHWGESTVNSTEA